VFVCECGPNIGERLDVAELVRFAQELDQVAFACSHRLPCSSDGKREVAETIKAHQLSHVVVAGCSPRDHEATFMEVCREAGLNPHLFQMVNIREHCAWVISDGREATLKAKSLVRAGVRRVALHESLEDKEIDCVSDVMVVGAGPAGLEAALALAHKGRQVTLVEKSPAIGGHAVRYEDLFPAMDCAACMLEPKMEEVLHRHNITLMTCAEVEDVVGFFGNFAVKVRRHARRVDPAACLWCEECSKACPVSVPNEFHQGLAPRKAIYLPYPGALPNLATIDYDHCLRSRGEDCHACRDVCPFAAINYDESDEVTEVRVGSVVLAIGFDLFDCRQLPHLGYGRLPEVYNNLEFERLLSVTGPSEGKLVMKNGQAPRSIAFVHCVGSRTPGLAPYCSGLCCMDAFKFSHLARKKAGPDIRCFDIYRDLVAAGKGYHGLLDEQVAAGTEFIRTPDPNQVVVEAADGGCRLTIPQGEASPTLTVDMVVLAAAVRPSAGAAKLAQLFGVNLDADGFFAEEHGRLAPVSTTVGGVFIAGCAQGPKDVQASVAQADAAAGKILGTLLLGEKLPLLAITAHADAELCGGCKTCLALCPYKAIHYVEAERRAEVNQALCKGCGTCAAACPSQAMQSRQFTREQLFAEIEGLLS
jgi:heterodisulfide reductase subunit A